MLPYLTNFTLSCGCSTPTSQSACFHLAKNLFSHSLVSSQSVSVRDHRLTYRISLVAPITHNRVKANYADCDCEQLMSFDRYSFILFAIWFRTGHPLDEENQLAKVCRPVALHLNVLFLLDGSGSVSGRTFAMQMKVLNKIANMMNIGKNGSQIAVLQYAGFTRLEFGFSDHQNLDELLTSLHKIRHMSGTTKTGKAMLKALDLFKQAKKNDEEGISQVAVVVTDGHSHDNPVPAAEALRDAGITILTLGIGEHINRDEIVQISGKDELAFQDLHKNVSLENFVSGFKNLSHGEHCDYAKGPGGAQITCGPDFVQVEISTTKKLKGRLFFEGYHAEPGCSSNDDTSRLNPENSTYDTQIRAVHGKCGLMKSVQAKSRGFIVTSRVLLQFDPRFSTAHDRFFEIRCSYSDKNKRPKNPWRAEGVTTVVHNAVYRSSNEDEDLQNPLDFADFMKCSYQVTPQTEHCAVNGISVGAPLLHQWNCDPVHGNFFVHSCVAEDPVTHREEVIVDGRGCPADKSIISELSYLKNGTVTAVGRVIRFADAPVVRFSCRLRLCNGANDLCNSYFPPQCRSKREAATFDEVKPIINAESVAREYDDLSSHGDKVDDDIVDAIPGPGLATMNMMEEKTPKDVNSSSQPVRSAFSIKSLQSVSSIAPPFPSGGIDFTLNSKSVAIVKTDQARDRFKEALQLRANSSQTAFVQEIAARNENAEKGEQTQGNSQIVTASIRSEPSKVNMRQDQGFLREIVPPLEEFYDGNVKSLTQVTTTEAAETVETAINKNIEATSTKTTSPILTTITTQSSAASSSTWTATITEVLTSSDSFDDVEEEVIVTSTPLLVRLLHEKFTTGQLRSPRSLLHSKGVKASLVMQKKIKKRKKPLIPIGEEVGSTDHKYVIVSVLGSGGFGNVYKVKQLDTGKYYALKTEDVDIDSRLNRLKVEATVLEACGKAQYRKHFIRLMDRGVTPEFKFIVMPIVGWSLEKIRKDVLKGEQFSKTTAIKICVQTLNALRDLHDIGFIHRDVKLANFAIGIDKPSQETIFMLDFGIAKRIAGDDNIIPEPREKVAFMGTRRFASRACHQLKEQGRKDDVESWCYMFLDVFHDRCIPWLDIKDNDELLAYKDELMHSRDDLFTPRDQKPEINDVYLHIPREMSLIFDYINTLVFEDMVDFDYILDILARIVQVHDWKLEEPMDWIPIFKKKKLFVKDVQGMTVDPQIEKQEQEKLEQTFKQSVTVSIG